MVIERIDFNDPLVIAPISLGMQVGDLLWEADAFREGHKGKIKRTVLSPGEYQFMPDYLDAIAPFEWRMRVNAQGEGEVVSKPANSDQEARIAMELPQNSPIFPVLVQNEEATHTVVPTIFTWRLGLSPHESIVTEEENYKWNNTDVEKLYPQPEEKWKFQEYPINAPAQLVFEVMRAMDYQNELSDERVSGVIDVIAKLSNSLSEEFLDQAVLGTPIDDKPVMATVRFNYSDLEIMGKALLLLPNEGTLVAMGISPENARNMAAVRNACLKYYFIFDTLFGVSGGVSNIGLSTRAYEESES